MTGLLSDLAARVSSRPGAYEIPSEAIALHFARLAKDPDGSRRVEIQREREVSR